MHWQDDALSPWPRAVIHRKGRDRANQSTLKLPALPRLALLSSLGKRTAVPCRAIHETMLRKTFALNPATLFSTPVSAAGWDTLWISAPIPCRTHKEYANRPPRDGAMASPSSDDYCKSKQ
jgi:hypothetical protein